MATTAAPRRRHPAQVFCLAVGLLLVALGLLGFVASTAFGTGEPQGGHMLVFEVNGWHNLVHLASGLLLLAGAGDWRRARLVTFAFGVVYGLVTIIGLIDGNDVLGLIPVDVADNLLHAALTIGALAVAAMPAPAGAMHDRMLRSAPGGDDDARFARGATESPLGAGGDMTAPPTRPRR